MGSGIPEYWPPKAEREAQRLRIERWRPFAFVIAIVLGVMLVWATWIAMLAALENDPQPQQEVRVRSREPIDASLFTQYLGDAPGRWTV